MPVVPPQLEATRSSRPNAAWKDFPLYRHGTQCIICAFFMKRRLISGIRSMPCLVITVGVRQELLAFLIGERSSCVAVSWVKPEGGFPHGSYARLSSTRTRCTCCQKCICPSQRLCIAMCQVYVEGVMLVKQCYAMHSLLPKSAFSHVA